VQSTGPQPPRGLAKAVLRIMQARGAKKLVKAKTMVSEGNRADAVSRTRAVWRRSRRSRRVHRADRPRSSVAHRQTDHSTKTAARLRESFEKKRPSAPQPRPTDDHAPRPASFSGRNISRPTCALTGGNFLVAESGRLVLVDSTRATRVSVSRRRNATSHSSAFEKILPRDRDLPLLLNLLGRSGTGQQLTVYTEFITGRNRRRSPTARRRCT